MNIYKNEEYYDMKEFKLRNNIIEYNKLLKITINKIKNNKRLLLENDEIKIFLDFGLYDNNEIKKYLLVHDISLESIFENIELYYNLRNPYMMYKRSKYPPDIYSNILMIQELVTEENLLYLFNNNITSKCLRIIIDYMDPFFDFSKQLELISKYFILHKI